MLPEPAITNRAARRAAGCPRSGLRTRSRSPWLGLLSAIMSLAQGRAELLAHSEQAWASATFAGSRHRITLAFRGHEAVEAGEMLIAALPDHEFTIPGHLVAEAAILHVDHRCLGQGCLTIGAEVLLLQHD